MNALYGWIGRVGCTDVLKGRKVTGIFEESLRFWKRFLCVGMMGRVIERRQGPFALNIHESSGCGGGIDTLSTARFSDGRADGLSITVNLTGTLNVRTLGFCYFRKKGWTDFNACLAFE
jgi:hypothetical protein